MHYLLFSLGDVRDLVIVLWGALTAILTLVTFVILAVIFIFARKGMNAVHGLVDNQLTHYLETGLSLSQRIRDRTSTLPGAPGSTGGAGEIVAAVRDIKQIEPPFRPRKKSWLPF